MPSDALPSEPLEAPEFIELGDLLAAALGDLRGLRAVDIGAGSGPVARLLAALGADATGVEPNADQVARAEAEGGGPTYRLALAEATGLQDAAFDLALFSLSLHHASDMPAALREACRVTRPGGRVVVIEPEAPDPIHPVMRFIDDESEVYRLALLAMRDATDAGALAPTDARRFAAKYRVETPAEMLADVIAIDSGRSLSDADRPAFEAAFAAALQTDAEGGYIPYWSRMDLFTRV